MEPIEVKALKPTISRKLQSNTAVQSAPLWLINPTLPRRAMVEANVAFTPVTGFITPKQFGPMMRMPPRRACSSTWRSNSTPAGPVSLKPAEMMTAPGILMSAQELIMPGTAAAGVVTTTRSTFSGTAAILGYALMPSTLARVGFTGYTAPPKGVLIKFQSTVRPTLPGFSVAPITATLFGAKMASKGCRRTLRKTSWDGSGPPVLFFSGWDEDES